MARKIIDTFINERIVHPMKCKRCNGTGSEPIGAHLRIERKMAGVAQNLVAKAMGLSPSYYCDLELGRRDLNSAILSKFDSVMAKLKSGKK